MEQTTKPDLNYFSVTDWDFCFERSAEVISVSSKQIDVSFSCICPVIDHKFCHNIVKVAVDPSGNGQVDSQTTLTLWWNSLSITGQTHEKLIRDINLFFYCNKLSNFPLLLADVSHNFLINVSVRLLAMEISFECANSSAVIVKVPVDDNNKNVFFLLETFDSLSCFSIVLVSICQLPLVFPRARQKFYNNKNMAAS